MPAQPQDNRHFSPLQLTGPVPLPRNEQFSPQMRIRQPRREVVPQPAEVLNLTFRQFTMASLKDQWLPTSDSRA